MAKLREIYEHKLPELCRAKARIKSLLKEVVLAIEDRNLVRAEVLCVRIKDFPSLQRKARKNGWQPDQALWRCTDLIGGRVVCNNIEDVHRFAELLKERLPLFLDFDLDVQDYISEPKGGGYRALHVNFRLDFVVEHFQMHSVPCEVQIQTRLQNAWAELSHDDIYKQSGLPEDLRARANDLAEILAAADKIASDIRLRVMREIHAPSHQPDLGQVSTDGLVYSFKEVFARSPSEYSVRQALNLCDHFNLGTLEKFSKILKSSEFRDKAEKTYRSILGVSIENEDVFLAALYAAAKGKAKAFKWVKKKARRAWREIEAFAIRETLSSLPDTIDDFIEELKDPSVDTKEVETWAEALGATSNCAVCSTTVVQPFAFAEAAVRHYEVSEDQPGFIERIYSVIEPSGLETGGGNDDSLCAYHKHLQAKDD